MLGNHWSRRIVLSAAILFAACASGPRTASWTTGSLAKGSRISVERSKGNGWLLEIGESDITLTYGERRVELVGFGGESVGFTRIKSNEPSLVLRSNGLPPVEWPGPELRIGKRVYDLTRSQAGVLRIDAKEFAAGRSNG